ncbi:GyrI-like domain-containing protein [Ideonella sp. DXS29W]|uniref:GyrI-like domain-containing protein n=1 Tax=Ideonella lacteola TaxID=2984193 RepID=A0ABU9BMP8_9BURK
MGRPPIPSQHYAYRLNQVLDHIDNHLDGDLSLEVLAGLAHFSRHHFLRVFQEWYGEAPMAYVRRRRLEAGAALLRYSADPIGDVAARCGFDTADGFTRAFRQYFGQAPNRWRAYTPPPAPELPPLRPWPVRIEQLPAVRVAYTRRVGVYGEASEAQWRQLSDWIHSQGLGPLVRFGMGLDDPGLTPPARCRYDVCAALPETFEPPPRTPIKMILGGPHAVLSYSGPPQGSGAAWVWLLHRWLPHAGHQLAPRAAFERYPAAQADPNADSQSCELCLPLLGAGGL